jgi:RNA-directed DNA polymerase
MKESYREGLTNHPDPEPCEGSRNATLEALDRGISRLGIELRNQLIPGADGVRAHGRLHEGGRQRETALGPAESKTPGMLRNSMRENREIPSSLGDETSGREENAKSGKSSMNDGGKSYCGIVPTKQPNKGGRPLAEVVEGRPWTKENTQQPHPCQTPSWGSGPKGLERVRQAARKDGKLRFTALLHHVTVERLRESYYSLKRQAAPGVDGVTWEEYGQDLEGRLTDLQGRIHRGAYRARPSRRVWIPKPDGRQRPLGVAALEDKIVQHAVGTVLNQIWEEDFLGFSYGFRPGRGAQDALWVGIVRKRVNWIVDLDIRSFFDRLQHTRLIQFVQHRIGDRRVIRLIQKWLKAGVMEQGQWTETKEGRARRGR